MGTRRSLLFLTWFTLTALGLAASVAALRPRSHSATPLGSGEDEVEIVAFPALPPPSEAEVRAAIERVFGGALVTAAGRREHWVGDFNGDGAEDLAVRGRPLQRELARINNAFAGWTVQDAEHPPDPLAEGKPSRATVARDDVLLAVIHGDGPRGWRQPEARQAYLVRNCADASLEVRRFREVAPLPRAAAPPRIDVAVLVERERESTRFLAWTGGRYVWVTLRS